MAPWLSPPRIKIWEALGCIGDGRIEIIGNEAKVYSSSKGKFYVVKYDPANNAIMSNDNASYWKGYLGYPAIAFLMLKGVISYNKDTANSLKDIAWKDINAKNSNDFLKTEGEVKEILKNRGLNVDLIVAEIDDISSFLFDTQFEKLGKKILPPEGY